MAPPREERLAGLDCGDAVTTLLQRARNAHPTKGAFQAAEVQFWWSTPHPTDTFGQLIWFDDLGRPEAAVVATEFGEGASLVYDTITVLMVTMPDASDDWLRHVIGRGLDHLAEVGIEAIDLEVDRDDDVRRAFLFERGFTVKGDAVVECWLSVDARPPVSPLPDGYRLAARRDLMDRSHHMTAPPIVPASRNGSTNSRCTAETSTWSSSTVTTTQPRTHCSGTIRSPAPGSSSPSAPSTSIRAVA